MIVKIRRDSAEIAATSTSYNLEYKIRGTRQCYRLYNMYMFDCILLLLRPYNLIFRLKFFARGRKREKWDLGLSQLSL